MMRKIRKNDEVIVLTGKDKGKRGAVQQWVDDEHVIVTGVNVAKKAEKPNPGAGTVGGIVDKLMPIHISNVALFNSATGKADRVGFKFVDGEKVRVFKSNDEVVRA
jgi:large subunit ribosomal protein L24